MASVTIDKRQKANGHVVTAALCV